MTSPLEKQVGGSHYKDFKIQPIEFIVANDLSFCEANIVKYACRHRAKGGREDIKKVIHYAELLLQLEYPDEQSRLHDQNPERRAGALAPNAP